MPEQKPVNRWTHGRMAISTNQQKYDELDKEVAQLQERIVNPSPLPQVGALAGSDGVNTEPAPLLPALSSAHKRGAVITGLSDLMAMAELIHKSGVAPRGCQPPAIAALIQFGLEIGLGPMQGLNMLYVVQGKIAWYAKSLLALVQAHPEFGGIDELWDGETATCKLSRKGKGQIAKTFSMKEARDAGIIAGENWRKYPCDMAMAKARKRACDALFSDVLLGLPDESDGIE